MQIDRAGTFRGSIVDHGVSASSGGFPQFTARLKAMEFYDEDAGEYVAWDQYDQFIDAYLVLYTKDGAGQWKELMHVTQIKKVTGWDGLTFEGLAAADLSKLTLLFRVEDHEFRGKAKLQVQWIDDADASPTRTLPKYDANKLKALTAAMGGALTASAPAPAAAPKSAKPAVPPGRKPGKKPLPKSDAADVPAAPSTVTPPPASPAPGPIAPSGSPSEPVTKASAWAKCYELNSVGDEKLAEVWVAEAGKIGKAEDQFTAEDWHTLQEAVLAQVSKF